MTSKLLLRTTVTLSSVILAVGISSSVFAQASNADMAECQQLYGQWSKYNGTSSYSKEMDADMALEDCRKGNTSAGVAELKDVLNRGKIPMPQSETAATPNNGTATH